MVPELIVTCCLCLAPGYLDKIKERCCCLWECPQFYFRVWAPHISAVRSYISCSLRHSHRPLRIPLTNSTPRQTDKCLHYAGQPPTLSADTSKEVFKWQTAVICCDVTWHDDILEWQTQQWCASWDSVNWKWEIKSWISQWIYVSKFWRIILFLNVWWR